MTKTETIQLEDEVAVALAGHHDAVLDALRERAGCNVSMRGNEITLSGDAYGVERGRAMVKQLVEIYEGGTVLTPDMVGVVEGDADNEVAASAQVAAATGKGATGNRPGKGGDRPGGSRAAAAGSARTSDESNQEYDSTGRPTAKDVFTDVVL